MNVYASAGSKDATITAVLGPTNTGKTHYAIERMISRETGIIGLPLRLLAREVYDKVVRLRGERAVALITGEEKIQPKTARYFICTVEAMPLERQVDFVAIDEVQMCADPERGHIFTDRLLRARGRYETLFLGSDVIRPRIASLVPKARFMGRERYSTLAWAGERKLSRLKPRTAVVGFSVDSVYAIAELIRRQRGGAAVVMGALSPRTRNAQVDLYQQGDVDYLVATDAIGMGLNLDIDHVAFSGLSKFDGQRRRNLEPNELAQIAGRAGRYTRDGTFGVTGEAPPPDPEVIDAIEGHRFKPLRRLLWRNHDLDFGSVPRLLRSLDESPASPDLARAREASDQTALRLLWDDGDTRDRAARPDRVRLLWDVCQIPDFRKTAREEHAHLIGRIYRFLLEGAGVIPSDWIAGQIRRIDKVEGDIDTLSKRLAHIRTWTFVTHRVDWVEDAVGWQGEARAVEDRLSDALHARLTQRFVDRRTSVLMRRLKQKERLVAEVNDKGEVTVEGEYLGRLEGFRFTVDQTATADELKTLRSASLAALQSEFAKRADKLYTSPDSELELTEQGGILWGTDAIGRLEKGDDTLAPKVIVFVDDTAEPAVVDKVKRRCEHFVQRRINALFEPLLKTRDDETVTGLARGVAFQLVEAMGILPRRAIADDIKALGQDERALLRKHGMRFGQHTIFLTALLKPAPTRLRLLLWSLREGFEEFPAPPPPGQVTFPALEGAPEGYYEMAGYRLCGTRAVRIDMLERLADLIRPMDAKAGFEATPDMLSITGCTLDQFADIMGGLGFKAERGERPKPPRAVPAEATNSAAEPIAEHVAEHVTAQATEAETATEPPLPPGGAGVEAAAEARPDAGNASEPTDAAQPKSPPVVADMAAETAPTEAPAPAIEAPEGAEAPAPDADQPNSADEAAQAAEDAPGQEPTESPAQAPTELEVYYTFSIAPRRQGQRRRPHGKDAGKDAGSPDDQARARRPRGGPKGKAAGAAGQRGQPGGADGSAAGQANAAAPSAPGPAGSGAEDAQTARGGPRRGKGRGKGADKSGDGGGQRGKSGPKSGSGGHKPRPQGPKREDKPIDPDSPFAILQQLKNK